MPLIDKQGHVIEFEARGIERITSDIRSVNTDDIVHLFKNVTKEEIERPSGPVDIMNMQPTTRQENKTSESSTTKCFVTHEEFEEFLDQSN